MLKACTHMEGLGELMLSSSYSKISACRHYHSGNQIFSIGRVLWLPEQYMGCCCNWTVTLTLTLTRRTLDLQETTNTEKKTETWVTETGLLKTSHSITKKNDNENNNNKKFVSRLCCPNFMRTKHRNKASSSSSMEQNAKAYITIGPKRQSFRHS